MQEETPFTLLLRFEVEDTGIGIPPQATNRLFQSFSQADGSTTRKYGGTGLGLAISKQLTELMGGEIGMNSQEGQGSRFWFTARLEKYDAPSSPPLEAITFDWLHALLLVPNHSLMRMLAGLLGQWGIVCHEGIATQDRNPPAPFDLVIVDVSNPDAVAKLRSLGNIVPAPSKWILLLPLTQRQQINELPEAIRLTKPVHQQRLLDAILDATGKTTRPQIEHGHPATESSPPSQLRVLVAEDNGVNQKVIQHMLKKLGIEPEIVSNGQEALQAMKNSSHDLILMDCQMPEMDGFEATAEIRRQEQGNGPHRTIVAMTANAMPGDRERCLDAGMDDYLVKPVNLDKLANLLREIKPLPPAFHAAIDDSRLQVTLGNDPAFHHEMISLYLDSTRPLLQKISQALSTHDSLACKRSAHEIKGASTYIAAMTMAESARQLENAAQAMDWEAAGLHLRQLESGLDEVARHLERMPNSHATPLNPTLT
jgi:CheY-like chemotaxis protein